MRLRPIFAVMQKKAEKGKYNFFIYDTLSLDAIVSSLSKMHPRMHSLQKVESPALLRV